MSQINLLPKKEQRDLSLHFFGDQMVRFWVWVLISIALFLGLIFLAKERLNREIADTEGQIALRKQVLKTSDNELLKQQVEGLNNQMNAILNLQSQRYYWSEALIEISKLLPQDISLKSMVMDRASGKIKIEGTADDRESVLKFWADMHRTEYFKNIDFPLANLNRALDDPFTFTFSIVPTKLHKP